MRSSPDASLRIRPAAAGECAALSALCLRSKAHWGYDAAFLEAVAPYLRVRRDAVEAGLVRVAELAGRMAGVIQLEIAGKTADLDLLFIDPSAIGTGAGRRLFEAACDLARERGADVMTILSDPHARGFYEHLGAQFVENRPSDVFGERDLPWLRIRLQASPASSRPMA